MHFGELLLKLPKLFFGDIPLDELRTYLFGGEQQPGGAGVALEFVLGFFELDADVVHLACEPFARLLCGFPARLEVLLAELGGEGVGEVGGELWIGGVVEDFDEARFRLGLNRQVLGYAAQEFLEA